MLELSKADAQRLLEDWRDQVPARSAWFVQRWRAADPAVPEDPGAAEFANALRFVAPHLQFGWEAPDESLPMWLLPGKRPEADRPIEPDAPTAWLLDGLMAWNVQAIQRACARAQLFLFCDERVRKLQQDPYEWAIGDPGTHWLNVFYSYNYAKASVGRRADSVDFQAIAVRKQNWLIDAINENRPLQ